MIVREVHRLSEPLLDALSALDRRLFGNAAWGRDGFVKSAAQEYDHLFVAEEEAGALSKEPGENCRFLGYALLRVLDDAELLQIGVDEACRRQGIGRKLMQEVLRLSEGKNLFLEVREGNQAARRLYAGCGFSEIGRRKRYYADPQEDAILMELPLSAGRNCCKIC